MVKCYSCLPGSSGKAISDGENITMNAAPFLGKVRGDAFTPLLFLSLLGKRVTMPYKLAQL